MHPGNRTNSLNDVSHSKSGALMPQGWESWGFSDIEDSWSFSRAMTCAFLVPKGARNGFRSTMVSIVCPSASARVWCLEKAKCKPNVG